MPKLLYSPLTRTYITQRFGVNPGWYRPYGLKGHNGIDFRTKFSDTPQGHRHVRPVASGVVVTVDMAGKTDLGRFIRIRHDDGAESVYGHLLKSYVKVGERVERRSRTDGRIIALTDNTGRSTGSHLHAGYRPPKWNASNGFNGYIDFQKMLVI